MGRARGASHHSAFMGSCRLLVTRVGLIYIVDEFFIFSLLVLLKETKTLDESKISSCYFCVWCKSREWGVKGSPRFPCGTPTAESFSSDLGSVAFRILPNIHHVALLRTNGFNTLTISAKKLHRRCSTRFRMWSFKIKLPEIISFTIIFKIAINCKKIELNMTKLSRRDSLCKFLRFGKFFCLVVFKVSSPCKTIFKVCTKLLILPQLISPWCLYCNIWTRFYLF